MPHESVEGSYYFLISAVGKTIAAVSVEEGERLMGKLGQPATSDTWPAFIEVRSLYGGPMSINRAFLGYMALSSPETRRASEEWHEATTSMLKKKEPWQE